MKQHIHTQHNEHGFTIVELMIATGVFSVILLLATFTLIHIGQIYYKGVTSAQTQDTARGIIDDLSQAIQFGGAAITAPAHVGAPGTQTYFCAGDKRYTYLLSTQLVGSNHVLIRDNQPSGCTDPKGFPSNSPPDPGYTELLSSHMRLAQLGISKPIPTQQDIYQITIRLVYGDDDLLCSPAANDCASTATSTHLNAPDLSCKTITNSSFCQVSELTTIVQNRVQ